MVEKEIPELSSSLVTSMHTEFQQQFFAEMGPRHQFQFLYDAIPDVFFFTKDRDSRMVWANRQLIKRLGARSEEEVIGANDSKFFPMEIAKKYRADDCFVMETSQPINNRVEVFYNETKILDWHITSKIPLFNADGSEVIGVAGVMRSYKAGKRWAAPASEIEEIVEYMRTPEGSLATVEELAQRAHLSSRQLNRKFQAVFGMSVRDFKIRTRLNSAADDLTKTELSVCQIAVDHDFSDQSTFSRLFRKHMGMTPLEYRRSYRNQMVVGHDQSE